MKKLSYQNIVFLFTTLLTFVLSEGQAQTYRILPLGNSITRGDMCVNGSIFGCTNVADIDAVGYRQQLFHLLDSAGYDFDFVGSESFGGALMTDADNAGFSGISSDALADLMETGTSLHTGFRTPGPYLDFYPADIVLLHIGTNDILGGDYNIAGVERILNAIDSYETSSGDSVVVFLSEVISSRNFPCGTDPGVTAFNDNLEALAASRILAGDKLHLINMECDAGLIYTVDMIDEAHPNQTGYNKIAGLWYSYVHAYLHPDVPEAPSDMTFSLVTDNSMRVNWVDNSDNEDNFVLERSLLPGNDFIVVGSPTINSFDDSGLSAEVEYFYRVRAVNDSGPSAYLSGSQTTPQAIPLPEAPTSMTFTLVTANSMRVNWVDNSLIETNFEIQRSLTGTGSWTAVVSPTVNFFDYSGLAENTEYFYRVRAVNATGPSAWLFGNETTLLPAPAAPTTMTFTLVNVNSMRVNWVDNSLNEDNFEIQRSLNGINGWTNLAEPIVNYYVYSGLAENTEYFYRVRAVNTTGESAWLSASQKTLLLAPAAPTTMTFTLLTANSMRVNWVDNSLNEANFEIQRSLNGLNGWSTVVSPIVNYYVYSGLAENTEYFYRVRAVNATDESAWLSGSQKTLLLAPAAPTTMTFTLLTANSMRVNWVDNSLNEANFEIQRSLNGINGWTNLAEPTVNYYVYSGLAENTEYFYRVRAVNATDESAWLSASQKTLLLAPNAPSSMTFSLVAENSMRINWVDNSLNEANFEVRRSLNGLTLWSAVGSPTLNYIDDSGLAENTEFFYQVRAVNATANSAWIAGSQITLLSIPVAPNLLQAAASDICSVELKWNDRSDNEAGFEVQRSTSTSGGFVPLQLVAANVETYTDTDTENNQTYSYRIRAFNDAGSALSSITSVSVSVALSGGLIADDQEVCPEGDPALILNTVSPSGGSNDWSYQWQSRIAPAAFSDITGAIALSYNPLPGALLTTEYQRVSTVECGSVPSNTVVITVDDLEAPVFSLCPADTIIEIDRDQTLATVSTRTPVVIDNCVVSALTWSMSGATSGDSPLIGINLLGPSDFLLGITRVTYIAEDLMGNRTSCVFDVAVKIKDPEILDVSIPNGIMKIGDPITATIVVAEDGGTEYVLISGSIGAYPLQDFQRINSTTYLANFLIIEGGNSYEALEDIPVENLLVSDGVFPSEPYITPISQDLDLLDAELPIVISADLVAGDYKIGDQVVIDIQTDGVGYMINPTSTVNDISVVDPNISFIEIGLGSYQLIYLIEEGNTDIALGEFVASLIFDKPSGNIGDPYTTIGNVELVSIDANAPLVTRLEVENVEVGVGGLVVVTVTADTIGYTVATGTLINGVPISSDLVTFEEISLGLYALSYEVSAADNVVAAGDLEMSIILTDEAGNDGVAFAEIEENELEIYTLPPYTHMVTLPEICEGEESELIVYLVGREPFSFELFDGDTTVLFENIDTSTYTLLLSPTKTTEYSVPLISDRNGVENSGSGSITVTVNETTPVQITNLETGYNVETAPFKLTADLAGGIFSGPGVNSATGYFDPAGADTINSPHTLYYTYANPTGCESVDSALVFVLGADGDIFIPSLTVCDEADAFEVSASNVAGATGSFILEDSNGNEVAGLFDNGDNTASVDPAVLTAGVYTVVYAYLDGVFLYIRKDFELVFVIQPVILSPSGSTVFCQNGGTVKLVANDPNAFFTGDGVSGSVSDGYIFDPVAAPEGETTITCTVSSAAGCEKSVELVMVVKIASDVSFTVNSVCLPLEGGMISFNNLSTSKLEVETWSWDFGDPLSGADNYSNEIDPEHFYQTPGEWTISLTATTFGGCLSRFEMEPIFSSSPNTDFTWISDCFMDSQGVEFVNLSSSEGLSAVESVKWVFMSESGEFIDEVLADSPTDTIEYQFPEASAYMVALQTIVDGSCGDTLTKMVELRPTYKLSTEGYSEAFDLNTSGWTIESEDENASWVWGTPDFAGFTPGGQGNSWYTDLPAGSSGYMERSWIQSPCFDFSEMDRPMIKMDVMKSFVPNVNGSVLQYMDERKNGWLTIGASSAGINWYNSYNIFNQPGGSPVGWGLDVFNPDTEWVAATHDLSVLKGKRFASLRLAIATNGSQGIGNQGFAFDNIMISEKTKLAVLEHFTNSSSAQSFAADILVDSYAADNRSEVIDIQYHTAYPGDDPMNQNNPGAASNRAGNLGVGLVPYAVLDGGATDTYRYDFSDSENSPGGEEVDLLSLEVPSFEIDLEVDWTESSLSTSTTISCMAESYQEYIQLYIVVLESSITAYEGINGDTEFRNVVLKMLPTPAGTLLGQNWYQGVSMNVVNDWTYEPYIEDVADLVVVAFVQNRNTKEILQAAVEYKTKPTGVTDRLASVRELQLYPNPAKDYLYVNLGSRSELTGVLEVYDLSGRMVMNLETQPGYQIFNLDVSRLTKGMYVIRRIESGVLLGRNKFIKTE